MLSTQYGANPNYFGHADYGQALARGMSNRQILDFLNANPGKIRGTNMPGQGGLYDEIARNVQSQPAPQQQPDFSGQISDLQNRFKGLEDGYKKQIDSLNATISKLQNSYSRPTDVGISNTLTSFNPASSTPMSIKQQGTERFNRKNLKSMSNPLKITNLNV